MFLTRMFLTFEYSFISRMSLSRMFLTLIVPFVVYYPTTSISFINSTPCRDLNFRFNLKINSQVCLSHTWPVKFQFETILFVIPKFSFSIGFTKPSKLFTSIDQLN
ncbi:hypothetical protein Syun_001228 [Stephania yunnanensis]|uniref:Uncharacterized protein n=1 Tax=Stephania yunnanensis TaxID=152371 RepID=A0AAP0Q6W6_9MAGN